jgi:hypothetical protein
VIEGATSSTINDKLNAIATEFDGSRQFVSDTAREGGSTIAQLCEALSSADAWLAEYAEHASWCAGNPGDCQCGLNHVRAANHAALAEARGEEGLAA